VRVPATGAKSVNGWWAVRSRLESLKKLEAPWKQIQVAGRRWSSLFPGLLFVKSDIRDLPVRARPEPATLADVRDPVCGMGFRPPRRSRRGDGDSLRTRENPIDDCGARYESR
jgi:hypothetical protein